MRFFFICIYLGYILKTRIDITYNTSRLALVYLITRSKPDGDINILEKWAHCHSLTHIIIDILNRKISTQKHQLIQSENCPAAHQMMDRTCTQDGGGIQIIIPKPYIWGVPLDPWTF
jgi:hypothetical protein